MVQNPDAFKALELAADQLPEDKRILYLRAKKFKEDPKEAILEEAEQVINEEQKE